MGFSRQEFWSVLPFPSLGDLSNPGIEPPSLALQADSLPPGKPLRGHSLGSNPHCLRSVPQFSHLHKGDLSAHLIVVS